MEDEGKKKYVHIYELIKDNIWEPNIIPTVIRGSDSTYVKEEKCWKMHYHRGIAALQFSSVLTHLMW